MYINYRGQYYKTLYGLIMQRFSSKLVRYTPTIVKTLAYCMSVIMLKVVAAFEPFKFQHQFIF
jgi:hypothetical protein